MELSGFKELRTLLKQLPPNIERRALQAATKKAMQGVLPDFRSSAPKHEDEPSEASKKYGSTVQNLKVSKGKVRKKGRKATVINTGDAFWNWFLEFGTRKIPAGKFSWFEKTFDRVKERALAILKTELAAAIEREARKLAKK